MIIAVGNPIKNLFDEVALGGGPPPGRPSARRFHRQRRRLRHRRIYVLLRFNRENQL